MSYVFAVITDIGDETKGGNLASCMDLFVETPSDDYSSGFLRRTFKRLDFYKTLNLRCPVFEKGEIVILDGEYGREVCYPGRKPSKWFVEVEHFTDLDEAVKRAREVMDEELKSLS